MTRDLVLLPLDLSRYGDFKLEISNLAYYKFLVISLMLSNKVSELYFLPKVGFLGILTAILEVTRRTYTAR